jgi:hypothetical protein
MNMGVGEMDVDYMDRDTEYAYYLIQKKPI